MNLKTASHTALLTAIDDARTELNRRYWLDVYATTPGRDPWSHDVKGHEFLKRAAVVAAVSHRQLLIIATPDAVPPAFEIGANLLGASIVMYPPCPCGWYTDPCTGCRCSAAVIRRHTERTRRLRNPSDLSLTATRPPARELESKYLGTSLATMLIQVERARVLTAPPLTLDDHGTTLLRQAMSELAISAVGRDSILSVAADIARLDGSDRIRTEHLSESIQYRRLDRINF